MDLKELAHHVELRSICYQAENRITVDKSWLMLKLHEEVGELTQAYLMLQGQTRDKGLNLAEIRRNFDTELGDVLAQVLLLSCEFEIDLESVIVRRLRSWGHEFGNGIEA